MDKPPPKMLYFYKGVKMTMNQLLITIMLLLSAPNLTWAINIKHWQTLYGEDLAKVPRKTKTEHLLGTGIRWDTLTVAERSDYLSQETLEKKRADIKQKEREREKKTKERIKITASKKAAYSKVARAKEKAMKIKAEELKKVRQEKESIRKKKELQKMRNMRQKKMQKLKKNAAKRNKRK